MTFNIGIGGTDKKRSLFNNEGLILPLIFHRKREWISRSLKIGYEESIFKKRVWKTHLFGKKSLPKIADKHVRA